MAALYCQGSANNDCTIAECMYSGNSDPTTAILCNGCTAKILSNPDAVSHLRQAQRIISYKGPKKLNELIPDVLTVIFENLHT